MQFAESYSHHNGKDQWSARELDEWLTDVFAMPNLTIGPWLHRWGSRSRQGRTRQRRLGL